MSEPESNKLPVTMTVTFAQGTTFQVKKVQSGNKAQFECSICQESFSSLASIKVHYGGKHTDPTLKCHFCGLRSFPNEEIFQRHVSTFHDENGENPLKCRACGKTSKDKKALWRHIRESHRNDKLPCDICGILFTRPENLKVHMNTAHLSKQEQELCRIWKCKECDKIFKLKTSLRQHVQINHRPGELVKCDLCAKEFKSAKVVARHKLWVHDKQNMDKYQCNLCPAKFRNSSHLARHLSSNIHKVESGRKTRRRRRINRPEDKLQNDEIWNGGRNINIEIGSGNIEGEDSAAGTRTRLGRKCKTIATEKISKTIIEIQDDLEEEDENVIKQERRRSVTKSKNKSQRRFGGPAKLEPCSQTIDCDGQLVINDVIKVEEPFFYVSEQDVELPYDPMDFCKVDIPAVKIEPSSPCHSPIGWRNQLDDESDDGLDSGRKEIKDEADLEKKYYCVYCEEGFSSLEDVKMHEKPCGEYKRSRKSWGCTKCEKIFPSRHALRVHMTRHSDERRFSCDLCPARFKGPSALKSHHSVIHLGKESAWSKWIKKGQSVPCPKCGKVLSNPRNLRRHLLEMHYTSELDKKPHKCQHCSNCYRRITDLKNHVRLDHEQDTRFKCNICSVWFNRQKKLDNHFKRKRHLDQVKKGKKKKIKKRHPGSCNILIRNLAENEESGAITKKVMEILLPNALSNLEVIVAKGRVGPGGRTRSKTIRPLRVILPSVYYKNVALKNASKLKKDKTLKHLKVTKDFWSKDVGIKGGQAMRVRY